MKTQNWIEGTAFVGGLVLAAAIWMNVHGWEGRFLLSNHSLSAPSDKQIYNLEKGAAAGDSGQSVTREVDRRRFTASSGGELSSSSYGGEIASNSSQGASSRSGGQTVVGEVGKHPGEHTQTTNAPVPSHTRDWTAAIEAASRPYRVLPEIGANATTAATAATAATPESSPPPAAHKRGLAPSARAPELSVRVYLAESRRIERISLEQYVRGVVAAEMPTDFEPAALQAQALAARTYIVRRLLNGDRAGTPKNADVTDTQNHQVYRSQAEMDKLRKRDEQAWQAVDDAVASTQGLIIAYQGEPIEALYFSSSNGYTENSEDVFGFALPYLRSVDSPWDRDHSPRAQETFTLPIAQFYKKLGISELPAIADRGDNDQPANNANNANNADFLPLSHPSRTEGHRIDTLKIGDRTLSGVQVRDKLGLRSTDFTWRIADDDSSSVAITTRGSGHGVGMSQWGAQGMALAGYTADQIISHYYTGTELMEVSAFL